MNHTLSMKWRICICDLRKPTTKEEIQPHLDEKIYCDVYMSDIIVHREDAKTLERRRVSFEENEWESIFLN